MPGTQGGFLSHFQRKNIFKPNSKLEWENVYCSSNLWKCSCNISNTRKSVSSGYPNTEKWVGKTRRSRVFLTEFEEFGYLMKHSFEFLIWLLKPFIILGEIQSKSLQNFMLIKIGYPNRRHGSDFLCFLFMNY